MNTCINLYLLLIVLWQRLWSRSRRVLCVATRANFHWKLWRLFISSTTIEQAMVRRTNSFNVNMRVKLGRWASAPTQRSQRKLFSALIKPHFPPSSLKPKYQGQKSLDGGLQIGHSRAHNRLLLLVDIFFSILSLSTFQAGIVSLSRTCCPQRRRRQ